MTQAPPADDAVLRVTDLSKRFVDAVALDTAHLQLRPGRVHALLGPNGAGKSTLLGILLGLVRADSGDVRLDGHPVPPFGAGLPDAIAGFVDSPRFPPYLTGRQVLRHAADVGWGQADVDGALAAAGLVDAARTRVGGYSLGMRQRLGVAVATLRRPRVLVLDEPVNGLDPAGARELAEVLRQRADDGCAVLLSSHDIAKVDAVADDVTVLDRGRTVFAGTLAALRSTAPDPVHRLRTSDDAAAVRAADGRPDVRVLAGGGGLDVHAGTAALDRFLLDLAGRGVVARELTLHRSALEAAFFELTDASGSVDETLEPAEQVPA